MGSPVLAEPDPELLLRALGYEFDDGSLLREALRHRSWCAEHPGYESNERLEFLGDAVLGLVVAEHLFAVLPDSPEGELAKIRASVVSTESLARVGRVLGLGAAVRLGKGEQASGGREKRSILADATEAVFGAVYLDGGLDAARRVILDLLVSSIEEAAAGPGSQDHKTRLQELVAQRLDDTPRYDVRGQGPEHAKTFVASVTVGGRVLGRGRGRSKKHAEQEAARRAWAALVDEHEGPGGN